MKLSSSNTAFTLNDLSHSSDYWLIWALTLQNHYVLVNYKHNDPYSVEVYAVFKVLQDLYDFVDIYTQKYGVDYLDCIYPDSWMEE